MTIQHARHKYNNTMQPECNHQTPVSAGSYYSETIILFHAIKKYCHTHSCLPLTFGISGMVTWSKSLERPLLLAAFRKILATELLLFSWKPPGDTKNIYRHKHRDLATGPTIETYAITQTGYDRVSVTLYMSLVAKFTIFVTEFQTFLHNTNITRGERWLKWLIFLQRRIKQSELNKQWSICTFPQTADSN